METRYHRSLPRMPRSVLEGSGRDLLGTITFSMGITYQYLIYIRGDSLDEVTEESLHLTYLFLSRALRQHRQEGRNGEFETFAVETLALLQKYRYLYTTPADAPEPQE